MPGLSLATPSLPPAPWPANAIFGIDFLTGRAMRAGSYLPLDQAMTFSRPSPRLARTRSGAWRSFAAGEPAITDLGLSLEPESTNLIVNNTGNSGSGIQLTGATMAPIGGDDSPARDAYGKRVVQGNGSGDGVNRHSIPTTGGQTYSWSQSFKYDGSATWIRFTFSDNVAHGLTTWLNLQTMTLGTVGTFGSAALQSYVLVPEVDGWHRLTMTGTVPNNAVGGLSTYCCGANNTTSRQAGSLLIWAPQIEIGLETSPIYTSGTATTRSVDVSNINLAPHEQTIHAQRPDTSLVYLQVPGGTYPIPPVTQLLRLWSVLT